MRIILLCIFVTFFLQLKGQECNDANHSVNINDSWVSCDLSPNPNVDRGNTHWVMYDLGYIYSIGATKFWNYNITGETDKGMKNIIIDYSSNGSNWNEVASFQLGEASGDANYEGEDGAHLGEIDARYILITSIDTWGDECAGLSEVRFNIEGTVPVNEIEQVSSKINLFPNPAEQIITIDTEMDIKELMVISSTGHEIIRMPYTQQFDISYLPNGIYFLKSICQSNEILTERFVKQSL
jgi:F5/8 type C domain.